METTRNRSVGSTAKCTGFSPSHLLLIEPGQATALRVDDERRCIRPPPMDRVEKTLAPVKSEKRGVLEACDELDVRPTARGRVHSVDVDALAVPVAVRRAVAADISVKRAAHAPLRHHPRRPRNAPRHGQRGDKTAHTAQEATARNRTTLLRLERSVGLSDNWIGHGRTPGSDRTSTSERGPVGASRSLSDAQNRRLSATPGRHS